MGQRLSEALPPRGELVAAGVLHMDEVVARLVGSLPELPVASQEAGILRGARLHPYTKPCHRLDLGRDLAAGELFVVTGPPQRGGSGGDPAEDFRPPRRDVQRRIAAQAVTQDQASRRVGGDCPGLAEK